MTSRSKHADRGRLQGHSNTVIVEGVVGDREVPHARYAVVASDSAQGRIAERRAHVAAVPVLVQIVDKAGVERFPHVHVPGPDAERAGGRISLCILDGLSIPVLSTTSAVVTNADRMAAGDHCG